MRILFVWPKAFELSQTFPLAYAQLVTFIDRTRHEVRLLDCNLDDISSDEPRFQEEVASFAPDLVGFSCWAFGAAEVFRGVRVVKEVRPAAVTAVGGVHVTIYPEVFEQVPEIDFIFRGESTRSLPRFLDEMESGTRQWDKIGGLGWRNAVGEVILNPIEHTNRLDEIPYPDYAFAGLARYHRIGYGYLTSARRSAPVFATLGCPFSCEFCCTPLHSGTVHRRHSIKYFTGLIQKLYDDFQIDFVNIMDDNLTEDMDWAKDLCRALAELDLPVTYCAGRGVRLDRIDQELFHLMKAAGFDSVTLPIESGSDRILRKMGKQASVAPVLKKARQVRTAGLMVYTFIMYGYPDETEEDIRQSLTLLRACRPDYFLLFRFNPLPGTPVYRKLVARNEIPEIGLDSIPYNFTRGSSTYTPQGLRDFNFRSVLILEYLRMFLTRPSTVYHYFRRNHIRSSLGVFIGKYIER